jgi:hypothetical protein
MRAGPWLIRLGLFAVGFGIGLSSYESDSQRPVIINVRVADKTASNATGPLSCREELRDSVPFAVALRN